MEFDERTVGLSPLSSHHEAELLSTTCLLGLIFMPLAGAGVEGVPNRVTQQVESQRGYQNRQAGDEDHPGGDAIAGLPFSDHIPPTCGRQRHAHA